MNINVWPFYVSVVLSGLLTGVVLKYALKHRLALPVRDRDVHKRSIPRIGGLAIFLAFFIVTFGYHLLNPTAFDGLGFPFAVFDFHIDKRLLAVLLGSLVLVAGMIYDDLRGLKPWQKLFVQFMAAFIVIAGGIGISYINNPFLGPEIRLDSWKIPISLGSEVYHFIVWADLLAIVWLMLIMNVLNFSDGIDGLAGTVGAIALTVLAVLSLRAPVLQPATALLAVIGLGSVIGFLFWNVPPARIFMGDSGAMFLGFLIGVLSIIAGAKFATTIVVLALPIIDVFIVLMSRAIKGQSLFIPDKTHLHHRFLAAGFSVRQTLLLLAGVSALFGLAALQNTGMGKVRLFLLAVVITGILIVVAKMKQNSRSKKQEV